MLVKSGFSRFAEDSFGHTMQSSECISLSRCTRDINPHLWGLHVVDASFRSEIQLLWARVGTETDFMLMHRSIRNFNFPPPWKLNSWKLVLQNPTSGARIMFICRTQVHFFLKKENSGNSRVFYCRQCLGNEKFEPYVAWVGNMNWKFQVFLEG